MAGTKQWRAADGRLQPGFQTAGFTLKQVGKLQALGAQTLYFEHEKSGVSLFYIRNKDTNRGFSISYRTPHLDETDTNHVFEHSVLASSDKYPSKDIFFRSLQQDIPHICKCIYLYTIYGISGVQPERGTAA